MKTAVIHIICIIDNYTYSSVSVTSDEASFNFQTGDFEADYNSALEFGQGLVDQGYTLIASSSVGDYFADNNLEWEVSNV
jgi:hypothetical protein